jgi:hypothetical protein
MIVQKPIWLLGAPVSPVSWYSAYTLADTPGSRTPAVRLNPPPSAAQRTLILAAGDSSQPRNPRQ